MIRTKRKDCSCGKIDDLHSIHTGEKQQRKVNKRGSQRIVRDAHAHFNPTVLGTRVHCEDWMTVWLGTRASGAGIHSGSGGGFKVIRRDTQRMESKTMLTKALWFLIPVVSETHLSMHLLVLRGLGTPFPGVQFDCWRQALRLLLFTYYFNRIKEWI